MSPKQKVKEQPTQKGFDKLVETAEKLQALSELSKKDYDSMGTEQKREVLEIVIFANNYYKEQNDRLKADNKDLSESRKDNLSRIKYNQTFTKEFADKFGKISNPTKADFVINQYLNWNTPERVIGLAVDIWDFCAQSTLTTINAIQGSKISNKKFKEFAELWEMKEAKTKEGIKVFKLDLETLPKEKVEKINYFGIDDFKAEAKRQKARLDNLIEEPKEVSEADAGLDVVEVDF